MTSACSSLIVAAIKSPEYIKLKYTEVMHLLIGKVKYVRKSVKKDFCVGLWNLVDLVNEDAKLVSADLLCG